MPCQLGMNPYVVYDGLEGLIDGKIKEATRELTSDMIYRGGTLLRSSRSKRFFDYEFRKQAYEHLKDRNIDKLVIMGGDGSFRALNDFFNDFEVPFAGIPATIDNDIAGTDYCLGVDTAQNVILDCIDSVRDTARSHHRAFVIETMGRDCGYLGDDHRPLQQRRTSASSLKSLTTWNPFTSASSPSSMRKEAASSPWWRKAPAWRCT